MKTIFIKEIAYSGKVYQINYIPKYILFYIVLILKAKNVSRSHNRHEQGLEKLTKYAK